MAISKSQPTLAGLTITPATPAASETFPYDSVLVVQTAGTAITVTFTTDKTCNLGKTGTAHDVVKSMGATETCLFGPFTVDRVHSDGTMHVGFSVVTNVKAFVLPKDA